MAESGTPVGMEVGGAGADEGSGDKPQDIGLGGQVGFRGRGIQ